MYDLVVSSGDFAAVMNNALQVYAVELSSITPNRASNDRPVEARVHGSGLSASLPLQLVSQGAAALKASDMSSTGMQEINCIFDLSDVTTGYWSVSAGSETNTTALLNAFEVYFPSAQVRAISRDRSYRLGIETRKGPVIVSIPQGTFAQDVVLTVREPAVLPAVDSEKYKATEVALELFTEGGVQPVETISLTFYVQDADIAGLDRDALSICYCGSAGEWVHINTQRAGNTITGRTRHLSILRILQRQPELTVNNAIAYPNPYRPGSGTQFAEGTQGAGIVFGGLTERATIKIFTMAGEHVADLQETNGDGILLWNTENDNGEKVASGVYIFTITDPDNSSEKRKGKVVIIR